MLIITLAFPIFFKFFPVVRAPIQGAEKRGLEGFAKGLGKVNKVA